MGVALMKKDGFVDVARDVEMGFEYRLLYGAGRVIPVEIEPRLANGANEREAGKIAYHAQSRVVTLLRFMRMKSGSGGEKFGGLSRQRTGAFGCLRIGAGNEQMDDAGILRPL